MVRSGENAPDSAWWTHIVWHVAALNDLLDAVEIRFLEGVAHAEALRREHCPRHELHELRIAKKSNVAKGTVYKYFANKDELQ